MRAHRVANVTDATPLVDVSERGGGSPAERGDDAAGPVMTSRAERVRLAGHIGAGVPFTTYRIRFAKVGRAAFLGHLDLLRLLARSRPALLMLLAAVLISLAAETMMIAYESWLRDAFQLDTAAFGWLAWLIATAELAGLTVLHLDRDFELIADVTGQPTERLQT